jgi:hypothetical protein
LDFFLSLCVKSRSRCPRAPAEDLVKWLQAYANEHHCYVAMDEPLYSPRFHTFTENPMLYRDNDDGYWYWTGKNHRWIDDEIPEELRRAPNPNFRVIYRPENPPMNMKKSAG